MTHEELLAKIDEIYYEIENLNEGNRFKYALRAVVKLHYPDPKGGCAICSWIINGFVLYEVCPTIQAIEKELS